MRERYSNTHRCYRLWFDLPGTSHGHILLGFTSCYSVSMMVAFISMSLNQVHVSSKQVGVKFEAVGTMPGKVLIAKVIIT